MGQALVQNEREAEARGLERWSEVAPRTQTGVIKRASKIQPRIALSGDQRAKMQTLDEDKHHWVVSLENIMKGRLNCNLSVPEAMAEEEEEAESVADR